MLVRGHSRSSKLYNQSKARIRFPISS